jgi:hypothetical protein
MPRGVRGRGGRLPAEAAAGAGAAGEAGATRALGAAAAAGTAGEARWWRPDRDVGVSNGRRRKQRSVALEVRGLRGLLLLLALCLSTVPLALPASFSHCKDECYNWATPSRGLCQASQKPNAQLLDGTLALPTTALRPFSPPTAQPPWAWRSAPMSSVAPPQLPVC